MKKLVTNFREKSEGTPSADAKPGDPDQERILRRLEKLDCTVPRVLKAFNFESLRPLVTGRLHSEPRLGNAGRPPFDCVMMLKILLLQRWYNYTLKRTESVLYCKDVREFLGIKDYAGTPKYSTIWLYRERFMGTGILDSIFHMIHVLAERAGMDIMTGAMAGDSTQFDVPVQHNDPDVNKAIKKGQAEDLWVELPAVRAHKDTDARWGKKHGIYVFGYKLHVYTNLCDI